MSEAFLQYIWQFQLYDQHDLVTTEGELIRILNPGVKNHHNGPDFLHAQVQIGDLLWNGACEIHLYSSGWIQHKHPDDPLYEGVVLHVVWEDDQAIQYPTRQLIPTLELQGRVANSLIQNWRELAHSTTSIACSQVVQQVTGLNKVSAMEKALIERIIRKSDFVLKLYHQNRNDWTETTYQVFMRAFGFRFNAEAFHQVALAVPYKVICKHADDLFTLRALLWGAAGLLDPKSKTPGSTSLWREYQFLKLKYPMLERGVHASQWKRLRLRPANFPEVRLDQLAWLLANRRNLFTALVEADWKELLAMLTIPATETGPVSPLGKASIVNLVMNLTIQLRGAYNRLWNQQAGWDEIFRILAALPAERNHVIQPFPGLGFPLTSSWDSQALLGLHDYFCFRRRCLECAVGVAIVKN